MINHIDLGNSSFGRLRRLKMLINGGEVQLAGNRKLRIYGKLNCALGKGMRIENRLFFQSKEEAESNGYRPCGHCIREVYLKWKDNNLR